MTGTLPPRRAGRIEGGNRDVEDSHVSNCPMPTFRQDHDRRTGVHVDPQAVELDLALAFEHVVKLGGELVVIRPGIRFEIDDMHRGHTTRGIRECAASLSTGTFHRLERSGIHQSKSLLGHRIVPSIRIRNRRPWSHEAASLYRLE